jgi:hypothetical protein
MQVVPRDLRPLPCPELKKAIERNHVLIYNWFYDMTTPRRPLPRGFHSGLIDVVVGDDSGPPNRRCANMSVSLEGILEMISPKSNGDWRLRR